jgi:hypothetical protein
MTCLTSPCEEQEVCRGLCSKHYAAVNRLVKAGAVTWKGLELLGKALPLKRQAREAEVVDWILGLGDGAGG